MRSIPAPRAWLLENNFSYDENTFAYAAMNGNLENMKWLRPFGESCALLVPRSPPRGKAMLCSQARDPSGERFA